jgi:hypothetical protein
METGVHLTVVPTQNEAEVICGMLRAADIKCGERAANASALPGMLASGGGWREILVSESDLERAQMLLADTSDRESEEPPS